MRIVIVTGLSGAGKSTVLQALEDVGFYCADNLPLPLMHDFVELLSSRGTVDIAISVDVRQREFLDSYRSVVNRLEAGGRAVEVLFLEAADEVLKRRYSETRRRHPLSGDDLAEGIRRDREILAELREDAFVIDTAYQTVHTLKRLITERFLREHGKLSVALQSFGFKFGLPSESDLVFDVRFLPNPHFEQDLRPLDGRDQSVSDYVLKTDAGNELIDHVESYLRYSLPRFSEERKLYVTVSVGCTGGRHRSVAVVEELRKRLADGWDCMVRHKDLSRGEE